MLHKRLTAIYDLFGSRRRQGRSERRWARSMEKFDPDAQAIISRVKPYTMLDAENLFVLIQAARYIHRHDIRGAVAQCGVWRGGAIMAIAMTFAQLGVTDRSLYLYDTFTGMTRPTDEDHRLGSSGDDGTESPRHHFEQARTGEDSSDWCRAGLDEVNRNLATVPYDQERFVAVEGKVEDTIPRHVPREIALLHLDTDWYASTRHELAHLVPRLVPKGVLLVDDYTNWSGVKKAVDEYLEQTGLPMFLTRVGTSAVGVRP